MVSNSQTLTRARLQLKGETFRSSQPWCGAAQDNSSQIAESHFGVRTYQDSVLGASGSTSSSGCCVISKMTGFLSCVWQRCQGFTLLTPCIWTHSHKDNKQPRQSFNHRYSRSQKHSSDHTVCVCVCHLSWGICHWMTFTNHSVYILYSRILYITHEGSKSYLYEIKCWPYNLFIQSLQSCLPSFAFWTTHWQFCLPFPPHVNQVIWVWAAFRPP